MKFATSSIRAMFSHITDSMFALQVYSLETPLLSLALYVGCPLPHIPVGERQNMQQIMSFFSRNMQQLLILVELVFV
jgi:hypothetical protein